MLRIPAALNAGWAVAFLILARFFLPSIHGPFRAVAVEMLPSKSHDSEAAYKRIRRDIIDRTDRRDAVGERRGEYAEETSRCESRRDSLKNSASLGAGTATLAGQERAEPRSAKIHFDRAADVVIIGAGAAGLPAATMAGDQRASVVVLDENYDIGGHAMLSGGRIPLGGGTSLQKKYGIKDSADQVYLDHTNHRNQEFRYSDSGVGARLG